MLSHGSCQAPRRYQLGSEERSFSRWLLAVESPPRWNLITSSPHHNSHAWPTPLWTEKAVGVHVPTYFVVPHASEML